MIRLNLVLLLAVLVTALYLVNLQHESRRLYVAMERARSVADRLAADHDQLMVQHRALATPARIQQLAVRELQMRPAHPGVIEYMPAPTAGAAQKVAP
jgi:cell division protein FtsL